MERKKVGIDENAVKRERNLSKNLHRNGNFRLSHGSTYYTHVRLKHFLLRSPCLCVGEYVAYTSNVPSETYAIKDTAKETAG